MTIAGRLSHQIYEPYYFLERRFAPIWSTTNVPVTLPLADDFNSLVRACLACLRDGGKIMVCGNGGSAAMAQHFAAELVVKYDQHRDPLPCVSLASDAAILTACANDFAFNHVFARQVQALGLPGDVLIALSTSGRSANVLNALWEAKNKRMTTAILTGQAGTTSRADNIVLAMPSGETATIQELHLVVLHALVQAIEHGLQQEEDRCDKP